MSTASGCPRLLEQISAAEVSSPGGETDGYAKRSPHPVGFHLDRAQPLEHAPGHDLSARTVRAGQHEQQLIVAGPADPVEVRAAGVAALVLHRRASARAARPRARARAHRGFDRHQQAAQRGAVASGAVDLFLQALPDRRRGEAWDLASRRRFRGRIWVAGSHAVWRTSVRRGWAQVGSVATLSDRLRLLSSSEAFR